MIDKSNKSTSEVVEIHKELLKTNRLLKKYASVRFSFLRGIASGFGAFIGATIVITVIVWFLSQLQFVPLIGNFAAQIVTFVKENTPNTQ